MESMILGGKPLTSRGPHRHRYQDLVHTTFLTKFVTFGAVIDTVAEQAQLHSSTKS